MIAKLEEISGPTRRLSAYIAAACTAPVPAPVAEKARHHLLDTLAAMISGAQLAPGRIGAAYVASLGGTPDCSVPGTALLTNPVNAALAGGMLAHADETDDSHAASRTHPGCAVVPSALAAAEKVGADGTRLLRAVVLGYDVCTRLNFALSPEAFAATSRMTHSFGGTFGAGAAAGALFGLDDVRVRHMLSYCAQQASGVGSSVRDQEHVEKAFDFAGMPARNGMTAATMAAFGMTGVDDVFSGERNFLEAYAAEANPQALIQGLGERFEVMRTNIKRWSVGSPAQAVLDAMTHLMADHGIGREDIERIRIHLPTRSARTVDNAPMPDVNVQHLVGLLLVDGSASFDSIHDDERMRDPAILALRARMELVASDELANARPRRQAIVEIEMKDGRLLSHRTRAVRGTADNPMPREEVEAKALDLIAAILGASRAKALADAIWNIEDCPNVRDLRPLWQVAAKEAGR